MASLPQWAHWQVANTGQIIATGKDYQMASLPQWAHWQVANIGQL